LHEWTKNILADVLDWNAAAARNDGLGREHGRQGVKERFIIWLELRAARHCIVRQVQAVGYDAIRATMGGVAPLKEWGSIRRYVWPAWEQLSERYASLSRPSSCEQIAEAISKDKV
jgi:hypothetical protein